MTEIAILSALGILFLIQLLYLLFLYTRIHKHTIDVEKGKVSFSDKYPPLSVIICAKDEADNLKQNLAAILEQDYPQYEVIVVNDSLSDESDNFLKLMENKYSNLYHTFTPNSARYISRKKLSVTIGIKASKYDWLVFTEANCLPTSKNWLKLMARNFTEETGIVLGYSGYEQEKGWFSIKSSFDNWLISMRYLGCALLGKPYMGRGRNMAYRKEYFFQVKGFSSHLNLQRGEDDLFINEIASSSNTRVEIDKDAFMRISPIKHKKEWKEEKLNYATTSKYFKGMHKYWMGIESFTRVLFYLLFIVCLVLSIRSSLWLILGISSSMFFIRYIIQLIVFNQASSDLGESRRVFSLFLFDLLQPFYNLKYKVKKIFRNKGEYLRQ